MRILLLSYVAIPKFAQAFGKNNFTNSAGWVVGIHNALEEANEEVAIVTPFSAEEKEKVTVGNTTYYAIPQNPRDMMQYNPKHLEWFSEILSDFKPDAVTIFGTEYTQGYAMLEACRQAGLLDHTVIFTQGLISFIERYYVADLPENVAHHKSLRERVNHMDVISQRNAFRYRGENEKKMLKLAKHIIGGTVWDKAAILSVNPSIQYHYCPEILRNGFYENHWDINTCKRHSLFSVQSSFYPVKGIHYLLEGMKEIVKRYPDATLYMTIDKPRLAKTLWQKMNAASYENYIARLMDEYDLWDNVTFVGSLNEEQLIEQYLKSHIFICPSSIENHSQTVSEAKILGVPTIASFVGGVTERICHGVDGYHYQHNAPYMIAEYVSRIFEDDSLALQLSERATQNAKALVDKEKNSATMLEILKTVCGN